MGAVVVRGNRIISCGHNFIGYSRYHLDRKFACSIHAEAAAIIQLLKKRRQYELVGATIYVSRIGRSGEPRLARPCKSCNDLIWSVGISKVVFTNGQDGVSEYAC